MKSNEILNKVMELLKIQNPVNLSTEKEAVEPEVKAEEVAEEAPVQLAEEKPMEEKVEEKPMEEKKEEKMAIEDVVSKLEERIKALEDKLAGAEVEKEVSMPDDMKKEEKMSAKRFTGAPKESAKLDALVNMSKGANTVDRVFARLYNK
jgi:hypothetical protein